MTIKYLIMQILYWSVFCGLFAFSNSFLSSKGFSALHIGYTLSIASILSVISQPYITKLIYKYKNFTVKKSINYSLILMIISYMVILFTKNHIVLMIFYILALIALLNIQTYMYPFIFEYINAGYKINFGLARGMGSISYSITSYIIGMLSVKYNSLDFVIFVGIISCSMILVTMLTFKDIGYNSNKIKEKFSIIEFYNKYKKFSYVLLGLTLIFTTHNALTTFLKNILESINYGNYEVGIAYMIASGIELPIMLLLPILNKKITYSNLFKISVMGFTFKVFVMLIATINNSLSIVYLSQSLQAFGFALYLPVSLYYVNNILENKDVVKGQTFLGISLTLGGILGNLIGGRILNNYSIIILLFILTMMSFVGSIISVINTENR